MVAHVLRRDLHIRAERDPEGERGRPVVRLRHRFEARRERRRRLLTPAATGPATCRAGATDSDRPSAVHSAPASVHARSSGVSIDTAPLPVGSSVSSHRLFSPSTRSAPVTVRAAHHECMVAHVLGCYLHLLAERHPERECARPVMRQRHVLERRHQRVGRGRKAHAFGCFRNPELVHPPIEGDTPVDSRVRANDPDRPGAIPSVQLEIESVHRELELNAGHIRVLVDRIQPARLGAHQAHVGGSGEFFSTDTLTAVVSDDTLTLKVRCLRVQVKARAEREHRELRLHPVDVDLDRRHRERLEPHIGRHGAAVATPNHGHLVALGLVAVLRGDRHRPGGLACSARRASPSRRRRNVRSW